MNTIQETQSVPVRETVDVLVVGGGVAGVSAALAARRLGARTLVLEKLASFGGLATNGLINWYEPLCNGKGEQYIYGLAEELLRLSIRYGDDSLPKIWRDRSTPVDPALVRPEKQHPVGGRYGTFYSPTLFRLALDELLTAEGVEMRLDIDAARPLMNGRRCEGVFCESRSGRELYPAKLVIDATGDAMLFARAELPTVLGRNFLSVVAHVCDTSAASSAVKRRRWLARGADLHGVGHPADYPMDAGVTNEQETRFLLEGRRLILDAIRDDDRTGRDVMELPAMPQYRTTRRIAGVSTLENSDQGRACERSVGLIADFERVGEWYELPFETLYTAGCDNLLAAGRMISSDGWAWDVTRVIPVCALSGQAAGTAAALACIAGKPLQSLPIDRLQSALEKQGVRLHP